MTTGAATVEADLWVRWRIHGDQTAREQLAERYAGYARVVAATCYSRHFHDEVEFNDYLQFACVGLMEALDRFDPQHGVLFKTFASYRMRGAILDGTERMTEKRQQIAARTRLRAQRLEGIRPAPTPDGETPGPDHSVATPVEGRIPVQVLSFVAEVGLGLALSWLLDGTGMIEDQGRAETIPFYRSVELREMRQRLLELVETLPANERTVIRAHYLQEVPFEQIAIQLNVTRSRVSQIHRKGIERLRGSLHTEPLMNVLL